MYLYLGQNTVVEKKSIIGVFDLDTSTVSKNTRTYLNKKEKEGLVETVGYDLPKSFVLCSERGKEKIYLSQFSSQTLSKR